MAALAVKDEYQGLAAAVSLGITVLKRCKQNTWAELTDAMAAADPVVVKAFKVLELSDEQLELIGAHQPELGLLRITPSVTHVICPACGTYILSSDTAPTRCLVTPGCSGKPAKIGAAVNAKKPVEEPSTPAAEADVPELEVLKANLSAAVETVHSLLEDMTDGQARKASTEKAQGLAEAAAAEEDEDGSDDVPPPPARRGPIVLDDDNDFD